MGAISKNVLSEGEWCAPTRELKNSKLLKLVHQTRKITSDRAPNETEVTQSDDVVLLVNRKPDVAPPVTPETVIAQGTQPGFDPGFEEIELDDEEEIALREKLERTALAPITLLPDGSLASYPVYRDRLRPVRVALIATLLLLAAAATLLFVLL